MTEHIETEQLAVAGARPAVMGRAQKVARAVELRGLGMSYRAIAEALGWRSPATAHEVVQRAMRNLIREATAEAVALEADRLDNYLRALAPRALAGDLEALDRAIRISESRRRLLGLDMPVKVAPTDPQGQREYVAGDDERAARIAAILDAARERRDRQPAAPGLDRGQPVDQG